MKINRSGRVWGGIFSSFTIMLAGLMVAGTKGCQEDYDLGSQSSVPDNTSTPTPTTDSGEDIVTRTPTPSPTVEPTQVIEPTKTPASTPTVGPTASTNQALNGGTDESLFQELSLLSESDGKSGVSQAGGKGSLSNNWLGKSFGGGKDDQVQHSYVDADGDGFADWLEEESGTNPNSAGSIPDGTSTRLSDRLKGIDSDGDGLSDEEELSSGLNPNEVDTDGDGRWDGAEVISGGDAKNSKAGYQDDDGDGLSNRFEESRGSSPSSPDSDNDGLLDNIEVAVGTNPTEMDSDKDGISDGKEYQIGSDPLRVDTIK